jgi:cysteinyl-tRNA synthetase
MIKITNTLTGKKEEFIPLKDSNVLLYVCGVTPYDDAHIGHGRVYMSFDMLYRLLHLLGYTVTYCRNFTDIDDKLLKKAACEYGDELRYREIADRFIARYHQDMDKLGCLHPNVEPRVTDNIPAIIDFIERLIKAGKAYESEGDVYFDIATFPDYGKLSGRKTDDLLAGARVEINEKKRSPLDFALWKSESEGTFWKSPWGYGRPGWHIECSTLAAHYLDRHIDIHAGGLDLIFPHHENEIAQSEGLHGAPFARYWMHNGMVRIDQEKMSKSLGNFFTLRDLFQKFDPMVLRYYIVSHHYRAPLDFAFDDICATEKSYRRLTRIFEQVPEFLNQTDLELLESPTVQKMLDFLMDDLNTPGALGVLFDALHTVQYNMDELASIKAFMQRVFGLTFAPLAQAHIAITPEIQQLIDLREAARTEKNWTLADQIRDQLVEMGVSVQDQKK